MKFRRAETNSDLDESVSSAYACELIANASPGARVLLVGLDFMVNALEVRQNSGDIRNVRRTFGIKVKEQVLRRADFVRFTAKASSTTHSGSKQVVRFSVIALDRNGTNAVVRDGFNGAIVAESATEFIGQ